MTRQRLADITFVVALLAFLWWGYVVQARAARMGTEDPFAPRCVVDGYPQERAA